ncbi:hypothetical protein T265_03336 [Opisthorchis viverrini]|uniref:Uncharacterized protein n=1 Tax=Opisthorchis viverrini TaxID=6198 RepID=A0A074ZWD6_OPIVI|nr:hypothetical protein T265_03336 [Opisthorchis viverrini]KER30182.1 hypothetical protein T265_03336 [Opisthorchis viverrini]
MSAFDKIYRSAIPMKFFTKGWGKPEVLRKLVENTEFITRRDRFETLVAHESPITFEQRTVRKNASIQQSFAWGYAAGERTSSVIIAVVLLTTSQVSAHFTKRVDTKISTDMPTARWNWGSRKWGDCYVTKSCIKTYYRRRLFLANRLLEDGIASIIIMNPFYSKRKPKDQRGSCLNYVSDLFIMGGALITECATLLRWCETNGYGPVAIHGISMGGYMASLCATVWPKPISLIPCLSWTTASVVFVDGIMAGAVDWDTLTKQYFSDSIFSDCIRPLIQPSIPEKYRCTSTLEESPLEMHSEPSAQPTVTLRSSSPGEVDPVFNSSGTNAMVSEPNPSTLLPSSSPTSVLDSSPSTSPSTVQSDVARTLYFLSLIPLKQLGDSRTWHLPDALRRPFDTSIWHTGMSYFRPWPQNISNIISTPPDPEVRQFLRELMDYFTHLGNFSPVTDPRLVLAVTAEQDAYVPRHGVTPLNKLYPGAEIRILPQSGHVGAYLRNAVWTRDFRQAITDCLNRQVELHYGEPGPFRSSQTKPSVTDAQKP